MIGVLIIAHDTLPDSLVKAVTHVLGVYARRSSTRCRSRPPTIRSTSCQRRARSSTSSTPGDGVLIFSDIYGATPCNLAGKLQEPGRVELIAGVNLPMLVRAFTYRAKGMDTMITKAVSGGRDGVLRIELDPVYASARG